VSRNLRRRLGLALAIFLAVAIAVVAALSWRSPDSYPGESLAPPAAPPLTNAEYAAVHERFERPYLVRCARPAGGAAVVFGASHTEDPDDPQIAAIDAAWTELRPTVALVESRPGGPLAALNPVGFFGEGGETVRLARRDEVPVWSWEPSRETEIARQLELFPQESVALFYILRPYVSSLRHGKPADPDAEVEGTRGRRSKWKGLEGAIDSVAEIDAIWRRDFAGLPDWRDTSDEHGWPGYLQAIFERSNELRDDHFARLVAHLVAQGERVFATAGSSHAVKLEPSVRAACGESFAGTLTAEGERILPAAL
jgi:hypothetical protein